MSRTLQTKRFLREANKRVVRASINQQVAEFMSEVKPKAVRTVSLAGITNSFEETPLHSAKATGTRRVLNVVVEHDRKVYDDSPIPVGDRSGVKRKGEYVADSRDINGVRVQTDYVYGCINEMMHNKYAGLPIGNKLKETGRGGEFNADFVWLDFCGSPTSEVRNALQVFARNLNESGLIFFTFDANWRRKMKGYVTEKARKDAVAKTEQTIKDFQKILKKGKLKNLRLISQHTYYGSGAPMMTFGFSFQTLATTYGKVAEITPAISTDYVKKAETSSVTRAVKRVAKVSIEDAEYLETVAASWSTDEERSEYLRIDRPDLVGAMPTKADGSIKWAGRLASASRKRNKA
jgi:hypothetical protein|tara:strand:+ start:733 stop:1779 length:1047 start_codon:yes stop_codon:yes gene_type:complete